MRATPHGLEDDSMTIEELKKALGEARQVHHDAAQRTCGTTIATRHAAVADTLADVIALVNDDRAPLRATIERIRGSY